MHDEDLYKASPHVAKIRINCDKINKVFLFCRMARQRINTDGQIAEDTLALM
jgi:hypothetical protein